MNAQIIEHGIEQGHTHVSYHVAGIGQVVRPITDPSAGAADPRFVRTGFPVWRNYNRHEFAPTIVGVADAPSSDVAEWLNA